MTKAEEKKLEAVVSSAVRRAVGSGADASSGEGLREIVGSVRSAVKKYGPTIHKLVKEEKVLSRTARELDYPKIASILETYGYGADDAVMLKKGKEVITITPAERSSGAGAEHGVGGGIFDWVKKGWKIVKKVAKKGLEVAKDTKLLSTGLALTGNPVAGSVAGLLGYGSQASPLKKKSGAVAPVNVFSQSNPGISSGVAVQARGGRKMLASAPEAVRISNATLARVRRPRPAGMAPGAGMGYQLGPKSLPKGAKPGIGSSEATQHKVQAVF